MDNQNGKQNQQQPDFYDELMSGGGDWLKRNFHDYTHSTSENAFQLYKEGRPYSRWLVKLDKEMSPSLKAMHIRSTVERVISTVGTLNPKKMRDVRVSFSKGTSLQAGKNIVVDLEPFSDERQDIVNNDMNKALDVTLGYAVHEALHVLRTEQGMVDPPGGYTGTKGQQRQQQAVRHLFWNTVEDERIEKWGGDNVPGFMSYVAAAKRFTFEKYKQEKDTHMMMAAMQDPALAEVMDFANVVYNFIRYPGALTRDEVLRYENELRELRDAMTPFPETEREVNHITDKIYRMIEDKVQQLTEPPKQQGDGEGEEGEEGDEGDSNDQQQSSGKGKQKNDKKDKNNQQQGGGKGKKDKKDDDTENDDGDGDDKDEENQSDGGSGDKDEQEKDGDDDQQQDKQKGGKSNKSDKDEQEDEQEGGQGETGDDDEEGGEDDRDEKDTEGDDDEQDENDGDDNGENEQETEKGQEGQGDTSQDQSKPQVGNEQKPLTPEELADRQEKLREKLAEFMEKALGWQDLSAQVAQQDIQQAARALNTNTSEVSRGEKTSVDDLKPINADPNDFVTRAHEFPNTERLLSHRIPIEWHDRSKPILSDRDRAWLFYERALQDVSGFAAGLRRRLQRLNRNHLQTNYGQFEGELDETRLADTRTKTPFKNFYKQEFDVKNPGVTAVLLLDESGSFYMEQEVSRRIAVLFERVTDGLNGVNLFVYGHTTGNLKPDVASTVIFKYFEGRKTGDPKCLGQISAHNNNRDGHAILEVGLRVRRLINKPKEKIVMFVVSDGEPSASVPHPHRNGVEYTKSCVDYLEKYQNMEIIHIAVRPGIPSKSMFKQFVTFTNFATLVRDIGGLLEKIIKKANTA